MGSTRALWRPTRKKGTLPFIYHSGVTVNTAGTPACSSGTAGQTLAAQYDAMGNFQYKTNPNTGSVATYTYGNVNQPQQVTAISGVAGTNSYDNNGNMTCRFGTGSNCSGGTAITWNADNLPTQITAPTGSSSFSYGPDLQRYFQSATDSTGPTTTTYVGGVFEVVTNSSGTQYRHNIMAGGQMVAVHTITSAGLVTTGYLHPDHLGGIDTVTNDQGAMIQKMSYDVFGARRDPCSWGYTTACDQGSGLKSITDRGYTGQEQLDNVELIHMNGRVNDPSIGRMISADPTLPRPLYSQAFNRYAYVYNNPMSFIDRSGFGPNDFTNPFVAPTGAVQQQQVSQSPEYVRGELQTAQQQLQDVKTVGIISASAIQIGVGAAALQPEVVASGVATATTVDITTTELASATLTAAGAAADITQAGANIADVATDNPLADVVPGVVSDITDAWDLAVLSSNPVSPAAALIIATHLLNLLPQVTLQTPIAPQQQSQSKGNKLGTGNNAPNDGRNPNDNGHIVQPEHRQECFTAGGDSRGGTWTTWYWCQIC